MSWQTDFLSQPLFSPISLAGKSFSTYSHWPNVNDYNNLLAHKNITNKTGKKLAFITQTEKSTDFVDQYEPKIYLKGEVQTRPESWHDFFNAMVWLTFPKTKAEINSQQYSALQQRLNISKTRSPIENVLTLFDENGAIIFSHNEKLLELLTNFSWQELFLQHREEVIIQMRCYIFGHSIYEKALQPYIGMTASSFVFLVAQDFFDKNLSEQLLILDEKLAIFLANKPIYSSKDFMPFPLLGFPNWNSANNNPLYYDNTLYFRSKKHDRKFNYFL